MELGKFASDDFEVEVPYGAPEDGAFVTIRYLSVEAVKKIAARATKNDFHPGTHLQRSKLDDAKFARLWGEAAVVGWRGFTYDGQPYPFAEQNRDALMTGHRKFRDFVFGIADSIEELTRIEREKTRGN